MSLPPTPLLAAILGVLCAALAPLPCAAAETTQARVIVRFKPDAKVLAKAALPGANGLARARAQVLLERHGVALTAGHEIAERTQVVKGQGLPSAALARALAADPDVEYAVPDERRRIQAAPNDPLYGPGIAGNGPASGQWYLRAPEGEVVASIDVEPAWTVTTGSPSVVVAVLDTGVRFEHPDLRHVASGGNLLAGYDFVSDPDIANDGDGRDADASDPGDWVTKEDAANRGICEEEAASSWHGTMVAGLIGALTDNGIGMASVARTVRILPVRVLGRCGGYDSDILAAMRWAAGLDVPGVPPNLTPARVLNLSLGGAGTCPASYRNVVAEIVASGAVIVASAGNAAGHAVGVPGGCDGTIAVGALRHVGTKVGFSNLGSHVALSAPGGNCVNIAPGTPCLYPILTTTTDGTTAPGNPAYTDSFRISVGTSFSAPLVAGTAALMLAARPTLTPAEVRSFLQGTTRPFPTTGGSDATVPRCTAPQFDGTGKPVDQLECYCTSATCGAGMLDAGRAVQAAQVGIEAQEVVEYYNAALDHYFITWLPAEIAVLDAGTRIRGWVRTGASFRTHTTPAVGTSPLCRYYIPPGLGDSHFFGRDHSECEATGRDQPRLVLEEARFMHMLLPAAGACPPATVPVYRVFSNRADANHRYTTDRAVRDQMIARGWLGEGDGADLVVMCAPR